MDGFERLLILAIFLKVYDNHSYLERIATVIAFMVVAFAGDVLVELFRAVYV